MGKPDPAEQSRSRRERILDAAFTTFAGRGYRDTAVDDIAAAAETSKGGVYFHFPTKESIFRELMRTTADKLVGKVERAVALETEPVARAEAAIRTVLAHVRRPPHDGAAAVPGHRGRRTRLPGGGERAPRPVRGAHPGVPGRCRGGRRDPAAGHAGHEHRLVRGAQRGGRALAAGGPGGPLEDAYPALRAMLLRSVGVPAERIGDVPLPDRGVELPGGGPMTAAHPARGRASGARSGRRAGRSARRLGERLHLLLDDAAPADAWSPRPSRSPASTRSRSRRGRGGRPRGGALAAARPRVAIVGIGRAWARSRRAPARFRAAEAAWRDLVARRPRRPAGRRRPRRGPGAAGRLGFTGRAARRRTMPWAPFGPSSLVLPELLLAVTAGRRPTLAGRRRRRPATRPPAPSSDLGRAGGARPRLAPEPAAGRAARLRPARHRRGAAAPETWERLVGLMAGAVGRGRLDKVVLARRVDLPVPGGARRPERPPRRSPPAPRRARPILSPRGARLPGRHAGAPGPHRGPHVPDRGHRRARSPRRGCRRGRGARPRPARVGQGPRGARDRRGRDPGRGWRPSRTAATSRRSPASWPCATSSTW